MKPFTTSTEGTVFGADPNLNGRITIEIPLGLEVPPTGVPVTITWERKPTDAELVRQIVHDFIFNEARSHGLQTSVSTPVYRSADGRDVDPFTLLAQRVVDALEANQ